MDFLVPILILLLAAFVFFRTRKSDDTSSFEESIETIIKELADKDNHYTNRNTYIKYDT